MIEYNISDKLNNEELRKLIWQLMNELEAANDLIGSQRRLLKNLERVIDNLKDMSRCISVCEQRQENTRTLTKNLENVILSRTECDEKSKEDS